MSVKIVPVRRDADRKEFVRVPLSLMRGDRVWVPPLVRDGVQQLDRESNPFFKQGDAEFFIAYRDGRPVGRISAHTDRREGGGTAMFGFWDAIDDAEVFAALWGACKEWHERRGQRHVAGPFNFNINGEAGVLVEGFDSSPYILMPHNPPYYDARIKEVGLRKAKDLYAWYYDRLDMPDRINRAAETVRTNGEITIRDIDLGRVQDEIRTVAVIFNESWEGNWGFVPFTTDTLYWLFEQLRPVIDPRLLFIVEMHGDPVAMSISLPNANEIIADLAGAESLANLLRLKWRLTFRPPKTARTVLLGVRPQFRWRRDLMGLSLLLVSEVHRRMVAAGYTAAEMSWTLEDNYAINNILKRLGAVQYKTYRIYESVA